MSAVAPPSFPRRARWAALAVLALAFAGLPSSALAERGSSAAAGSAAPAAAGDPGTISGHLVIPEGLSHNDFYVDSYTFDESAGKWILGKYDAPSADGYFEITGLEDGKEYRLVVYTYAQDYVGGTYAGNGKALVADPWDGVPVTSPLTDVVLHPVKSVPLSGTFSVPAGFNWGPGPLRVEVVELGANGAGYSSTVDTELREDSGGAFELPRVRPDGRFALYVSDPTSNRVLSGFHHAGVGLVDGIEFATPVTVDVPPHITVTAARVEPKLSAVTAPTISGTAKVDESLTANAGSWSLDGVSLSYQWLRDGKVLSGATSASYRLKPADLRGRISVRVTASKASFTKVVTTSAQTKPVALGEAARATKAPSIRGTARLGKTLKVRKGTWDSSGLKLSYQWLRGGKKIKGATKSSYRAGSSDVGKKLSVRVTAKRTGFRSAVVTSKSVKVAKGKPSLKLSPTKVKAGSRAKVTLKVSLKGLSKPTGTVKVKVGSRSVKVKLSKKAKGKVSVRLPALTKGKYKATVSFTPDKKTGKLVKKVSKKVTLRVK